MSLFFESHPFLACLPFVLMGIVFHLLQEENPMAMFQTGVERLGRINQRIATTLHISPGTLLRVELGGLFVFGWTPMQVGEYAVSIASWVILGVILLAKVLAWKGVPSKGLTAFLRFFCGLGAIALCVLLITVTALRKPDSEHWTNLQKIWNHPLDEPMERGYPHLMRINIHSAFGDSQATIVMENIGRYRILPPVLIRGAIIASRPLAPAEEEQYLFSGQENGQRGGLLALPGDFWDPGDTKVIHIKGEGFSLSEWQEISDCKIGDCKRMIYVVTKTYGQDKFGAISPKESCWYVSAMDWDHAKKCFGHND